MRVVVLGLQKVGVIVADQRQAQVRRQLDQVLVDRVLVRDVVLQLHEEARRAECLRVPERALLGLVPVLPVPAALEGQQMLADLAAEVTVDRDQPFGVLGQQLPIDPRLEVEPGQIRLGAEIQQVVPARVVQVGRPVDLQ